MNMAKVVDSRERVLAALLSSTTRKEAAKKAKVSERTVYQYMQEPAFAQRYAEARREMVTAATAQLQQALSPAVVTLSMVATDPEAAPPARVAAARALLEFGLRYSETTDILERLAALEQQEGNE